MTLPGVIPPIQPGVQFKVEVALGNLNDPAQFLYDDPAALYDTALYSGSEISWSVITTRAMSFAISRGRNKWGAGFRAGSGSLSLSNDDGVFNPNFGAVDLGNVVLRPGRFVRVSVKWVGDQDNQYVPLFTGRIEQLADVYIEGANIINSSWVLADLGSFLQLVNPPARQVPIAAGQVTSERVLEVLRDAGFGDDALTKIEVGVNTMGSSTLPSSDWQECQNAAQAEGGAFYMHADGTPVFRPQTFDDPAPPIWGAGGLLDDIEVVDAQTDFGMGNVRNDIQFARTGGTEQRVISTTSQALYQPRTQRQFDFQCETDGQVFTLAERFRDYWAFDQISVERCELIPLNEVGARQLMALELGDTIQLQINTGQGWGYTAAVTVQKLQHNGTADSWRVRLTVENSDRSNPLDGGAYSLAYDPNSYDVDIS